jgi:hypothetical protein
LAIGKLIFFWAKAFSLFGAAAFDDHEESGRWDGRASAG